MYLSHACMIFLALLFFPIETIQTQPDPYLHQEQRSIFLSDIVIVDCFVGAWNGNDSTIFEWVTIYAVMLSVWQVVDE